MITSDTDCRDIHHTLARVALEESAFSARLRKAMATLPDPSRRQLRTIDMIVTQESMATPLSDAQMSALHYALGRQEPK
jgi:hypothetical protein